MSRKNLILSAVLVVLFVSAYIYQGPYKNWQLDAKKQKNIFSNLNASEIDEIKIDQNDEEVILERINDRWKISGTKDFYAPKDLMDNLLIRLEEAKIVDFELISESKEKKTEFNTDLAGAKVYLFRDGQELINFIVGKISSDYSGTYISRQDSDKTFLLKTDIYSLINQDNWYDKTIFDFDNGKVNKIRFQYPTREFTIEKIDDGWSGTLPYQFAVDADKTEEIIEMLSDLSAVEIPEQNFENTGLEKHSIIIQVSGEDIDNVLMVGDDYEEDMYYVKRGDSDNIYLISKDQRDSLYIQIKDLQ